MISVIKSGLYSTLQDAGRFGFRSIGVPVSGAMDLKSARYANYLLGNNTSECVLEFTGIPPSLAFNITTQVAITGARLSVFVNGVMYPMNALIAVENGDTLTFSSIKGGWRGYIAIKNGFESQVALNSQSQYKGITAQNKIEKGEILSSKAASELPVLSEIIKYDVDFYNTKEIEVYKGSEFEKLSNEIQSQFLGATFTISSSSNRMAVIFEEEILGDIFEIITTPVQPGTIQLTPSGKLINLMRDAQTSGGYARVFQCTENSINILAQKRPKEKISFKLINGYPSN